jgi:hypothetical protein
MATCFLLSVWETSILLGCNHLSGTKITAPVVHGSASSTLTIVSMVSGEIRGKFNVNVCALY